MASDRPRHVIGEVWFEWAPTSLQVSESIVSRYVDPLRIVHLIGLRAVLIGIRDLSKTIAYRACVLANGLYPDGAGALAGRPQRQKAKA